MILSGNLRVFIAVNFNQTHAITTFAEIMVNSVFHEDVTDYLAWCNSRNA